MSIISSLNSVMLEDDRFFWQPKRNKKEENIIKHFALKGWLDFLMALLWSILSYTCIVFSSNDLFIYPDYGKGGSFWNFGMYLPDCTVLP